MKKIVTLILLSCITLVSVAQIVVDPKGTRVSMDSSKWKISGNDIYSKNTGNVGIGTSNPAYKLDVSAAANPVRMMGVQNGSTTDSVVTIVNGVIKKIAAASFNKNDSTTASNGLNINGKDVQLGGTLTKATTITNNSNALTIATGGTAMNITGLTSGAATDSIVTINQVTGKLNMINRSSILTGNYINNSSTQQASSNFNISGNGTVGGNLSISGITSGSMLYMNANGRISGVTNNLYYDTITKSMGIGTNAPVRALDVVQNNATSGIMKLQNTNANGYSSIDIWDNAGAQVGNIGYANNGGAYGGSFYFATNSTKNMVLATNNTERMRILGTNGNIGIGVTAPTAALHLNAGTATAGTAPLKLSSGTLLSTPESGALEFDGTHYYGTISGTRYQLDNTAAASTTNTLALSGNTLTSTVNGVAATSNAVSGISNTSSANTLTTTVNGVTGASVNMVNSISNTSSGNNLTTTVNGVAATAVPMVNAVSNTLNGTNLTTTVNGVTGAAINLSGLVPTTTNSLAISGNTLTSTVNGIAATSNAVSGVSNTSSANTLTTTVNGVTGSTANIINTNALGLSNGTLTSTVNGVASSTVNVLATAGNGLTATNGTVQLGGSLSGATTIATAGNALNITGLTAGSAADSIVTINTTTGKLSRISPSALSVSGGSNTASNGLTLSGSDVQLGGALTAATTLTTSSTNTLSLLGVQTGTTADSLLVLGTDSEIKKVAQMPTPQYAIVSSDFNLTNGSSSQSALPSDRNTFTATASTIYEVEGSYIMSTGTSNNKTTAISFGGTATASYVALNAIGWNATPGNTTSTQGSTAVITLSSTVITASTNAAGVQINFKGIIAVNTGGTITPQITFSSAPGGTNTMKAGSYIKFTPLSGSVNGSFN